MAADVKPSGFEKAVSLEGYNAPVSGSFRSNFYSAMQSKLSQAMAQ